MPSRAEPTTFRSDLGVYGLPGSVHPWDIRFDVADRAFCDRQADGTYRLRVVTEPGLVDGLVVVGDHYGGASGYSLEEIVAGIRFVGWELQAPLPPGGELSLAFRSPDGSPVYRVPSGISGAVERLDRWTLPDLTPLDVPAWAQGAVIYQIFPDRFADGDPSNNPPETEPWGSPPASDSFQGGDLAGVLAHLDHLEALGVDTIYLNPVTVAPSNHRYDAVDYHHVDPALGGDEALAKLVAEAHSRGMRVMTDLSINHVHPSFPPFEDMQRHGTASPYHGWFAVTEHPPRVRVDLERLDDDGHRRLDRLRRQAGIEVEETTLADGPPLQPTYQAWFGVPTMPRVDLSHPQARAYMLDVLTSWVDRFDIDAWRMDVARYVDPDVWPEARNKLRESKEDFLLLAEIMGDGSAWLQGDGFDATMNYTFRALVLRFLARGTLDAPGFLDGYARLWAQYAWPVTLASQNLIGSHDTPRFLTEAGGEEWRMVLAIVLQMTLPGAPGLYYGDEVGMEGGEDPGCRGAFPWDPDPLDHPLARTISELAALRRAHPVLRTGEWRALGAWDEAVAFERILPGEEVVVVVNRGAAPTALEVGATEVLWGSGRIIGPRIEVAARSAAVARLTSDR